MNIGKKEILSTYQRHQNYNFEKDLSNYVFDSKKEIHKYNESITTQISNYKIRTQ